MLLPSHEDYKTSGVGWLEAVPKHWSLAPPKRFIETAPGGTTIKSQCSAEPLPGLVPGFSASGQDIWVARPDYERDGLVLSAVGARCGKTFKADGRWAVAANTYCLFPGPNADRDYMWYLTNNENWWEKGGAAQPFVHVKSTLARTWAFPPLNEQRAIATFLDRETAKIDALVAEQRRLIALLKEKRQAFIIHAVTKGLTPDAPMKPSGIEWIGDVPEHWEVGPVKRFFHSLDGRRVPLSSEERSYRRGVYPYYGASGIIDWVDDFLFDDDLILVSEDGANLLNRASPIAFVATGRYWVNNHAHILLPSDDCLHYWAERLEAIDLAPYVTGAAQPKLTIEALMNLRIAVPPTDTERWEIQLHVSEKAAMLDELQLESVHAIELLQERRTALISAAVTGKIDVREFAYQETA